MQDIHMKNMQRSKQNLIEKDKIQAKINFFVISNF